MNRYNLYKILNPILGTILKRISVSILLKRVRLRLKIHNLNLGGFRPTESYVSIQLSPVELYGIPRIVHHTTSLIYDEVTGSLIQEPRSLTSPTISLHFNILNGLPVDSDSISGINMSHILEHLTRDEGLKVLKECYRALQSEGILRISCPDLLRYAKAYVERDSSFFDSIPIIKACCYEGLKTYGDRFISKAYDNHNGHKWFYDAESVIQLLKEAGFSKAQETQLHQSKLPNIEAIEPAFRAPESFYVEAIK